MSIFGTIMGKIFHHGQDKPAGQPAPAAPAGSAPTPQAAPAQPAPPQAATRTVDVGAVLAEMASMQNGGGNYQTSIVDLLNLLGLDHSLAARKELADELGVHAGAPGTAEQKIALHKAVMAKLAENGGVVPDSLRN
jgi:pyruvate/2-oxoglutarate dehydrogenase complex dihydrolipoamide acyltransferase (E2) component